MGVAVRTLRLYSLAGGEARGKVSLVGRGRVKGAAPRLLP